MIVLIFLFFKVNERMIIKPNIPQEKDGVILEWRHFTFNDSWKRQIHQGNVCHASTIVATNIICIILWVFIQRCVSLLWQLYLLSLFLWVCCAFFRYSDADSLLCDPCYLYLNTNLGVHICLCMRVYVCVYVEGVSLMQLRQYISFVALLWAWSSYFPP